MGTSGSVKLGDVENNRQVAELSSKGRSEMLFSDDGAYLAFQDGKDTVTILRAE
jgi:hypothetical protein